jgi:hypothetical protein
VVLNLVLGLLYIRLEKLVRFPQELSFMWIISSNIYYLRNSEDLKILKV